MKASTPISNRKWRGPLAVLGIWAFWVVLPAVFLEATPPEPFEAAQLGADSVRYLEGAPSALCWYLVLGQCLALPALIALAWVLPGWFEPAALGVRAERRWFSIWLSFIGSWALLYVASNWLIAALAGRAAADAQVVRGYAIYLGWYGFLATLPHCGLVFTCRALIRRSWLSAMVSLLLGGLLAIANRVLQAKSIAWPTPMFLRNELFSGRGEAVVSAEWAFVLWAAVPSLFAFAWLVLPTLSRPAIARLRGDARSGPI